MKAVWDYEKAGSRSHYVVEGWLGTAMAGRAYGWFEPGALFVLEKVEVDQAQRSKGYGSVLIDTLRAKARACGCSALHIKGVRAANLRAIAWYRALGAVQSGESHGLLDFVISPP